MKIKNKLIITTALFIGVSFAVATPLVLTSCSNSEGSGISFIDLNKYDEMEIETGIKGYGFAGSHGSENEFYNKNSTEIKTMLGIEGKGYLLINRDQFSRLISGVQFKEMATDSTLNEKPLSYSDIDSSAIDNQYVECYASITDAVGAIEEKNALISLTVTLKEGSEATWSNGSKNWVVFIITKI